MKFFKNLAVYADMVKIAHTLFALPFALSALCLAASAGRPPSLLQIFWIVLAFTAARSAAMGFNRIADLKIDALNPRTSSRPICAGKISKGAAWLFVLISCAVFVFCAAMLNALCFWLSFPALAWLFFYSYAKRFTSASHLILGAAIALSPLGAWIAVCGNISAAPVFLALAALLQICGFDLLYALQDEDFDKAHGLHSVPARFGKAKTEIFAAASFALSCAALFALSATDIGGMFLMLSAVSAVIIYTAALAIFRRAGIAKIDLVFFYMNVGVSFEVLIFNILNCFITHG